jgi:hypothetical protein
LHNREYRSQKKNRSHKRALAASEK